MKREIPLRYLKNLQGKKVILYLSAAPFREDYLLLPYDYVILVNDKEASHEYEYYPIQLIEEKVVLMTCDNNKAIRILKDNGVKIQCFVGICDGCNEGGNYECVNTNSFFGRLSPILDDKVYYITDHFDHDRHVIDPLIDKLGFLNVHFEEIHSFDTSLEIDPSVFFSPYFNNLNKVSNIPLQRKNPNTYEKQTGKIKIAVSHASVWDYEQDFDCIIHGDLSCEGHENYFPRYPERVNMPLQQIKREPEWLLQKAEQNKWESIGLIPYLKGHYQEFVDTCKEWKGDYPKKIHFFHLEDRDLKDLRTILSE